MAKERYKKKKKESFFSKLFNLFLTVVIAVCIGSQVCTAANSNLRLAQISDAHFSSFEEDTSYKLLKKSGLLLDDAIFQINTSGPYDSVIFTGDLINKPMVSELEKFLEHVEKLAYPWYAINGNHDISIDGDLTKFKFISTLAQSNDKMNREKSYYAFTPKKGYRVICLDSIIDYKITTNGEIPNEEYLWLSDELSKYAKDTIIICTHVPISEPYSSQNHQLLNNFEVKKLLKSHKNPVVVLQGHYHAARLKQDGNILYVSCPSLVTYPNAFRVINLHANRDKVKIDVFLKETNLKEIQSRSRLRVMGSTLLSGEEEDRNASFELRREE